MNQPPGLSKTLTAVLTVAGTCVGMCVGGVSMWFTIKDRYEKDIEQRVTAKLNMEARMVRLEEKYEALRAEVWTQRTNPAPNR